MLTLLLSIFALMLLLAVILIQSGVDSTIAWYISLAVFLSLFLIVSIIALVKNLWWISQKNKFVDTSEYDNGNFSPAIKNPGLNLLSGEKLTYITSAIYVYQNTKMIKSNSNARIYFRWTRSIMTSHGLQKDKQVANQISENGLYCITTKRLVFMSGKSNFEIKPSEVLSILRTGDNSFCINTKYTPKNIVVPKKEIKYALGLSQRLLREKD